MLGSNIVCEMQGKYEIFGVDKNLANPELQNQFNIDLTDADKIRVIIELVKPDFVIHCAALTNVDLCEEHYSLARDTNGFATKNLVSIINSRTKFIYISTDSVFDGTRGGYSETDLPSPVNNYAKSKLEGEWFVEQESSNYVIIRTNIFGWNRVKGQSFAEWIYNSLSQGKHISMFTDVIFSPISANTLSSFIDTLLNMDFTGRLNIGSDSSISKFNFGIHLARLFGLDSSLIAPVIVDTFNFKAKRPKNTSLDTSKAKSIFGSLPSIENELIEFYNRRSNQV
jgi:dTDP-4-dehydrorhamnose reductase